MKKFNIMFFIGILTLFCGCNTEMIIKSGLNVTAENDTWYCGVAYSIDDLIDMYSVSIIDSNDKEIHLSYGEYKFDSKYYKDNISGDRYQWFFDCDKSWTDSDNSDDFWNDPYKKVQFSSPWAIVNDGTEDVDVKLQYTVTKDSNGYYYNIGTLLESVQNIHFRKITKEEISHISFRYNDIGALNKEELKELIEDKFYLDLDVTLQSGSTCSLSSDSSLWFITGIDESSDIGKHTFVGHYEDLTTDPVSVYVYD